MSTPCYCGRCQSYRRMHWRSRAGAELAAAAARGRSSFEFELALVPADVPSDRPADGGSPEDGDRFASRQLQLWMGRVRKFAPGLRFHALIGRGEGLARGIVVLVHEGDVAAQPEGMRADWPGQGHFRVVGPGDLDGLRALRAGSACDVVAARASIHYGDPSHGPRRTEYRPRGKKRAFRERAPNRVLFGPDGAGPAVSPGPRRSSA